MSNSNSFTHTPCDHHIHEEGPEDKVSRLFCLSQCQRTQSRSKARPVYAQQWVYQGLCTPCKSSKYWSTWGIPHWCTYKYQLRASATAFFFFWSTAVQMRTWCQWKSGYPHTTACKGSLVGELGWTCRPIHCRPLPATHPCCVVLQCLPLGLRRWRTGSIGKGQYHCWCSD